MLHSFAGQKNICNALGLEKLLLKMPSKVSGAAKRGECGGWVCSDVCVGARHGQGQGEPPPWPVGIVRRCSVKQLFSDHRSKDHVQCHILPSQRNGWAGNSDLPLLRSFVRALKVSGGGAVWGRC